MISITEQELKDIDLLKFNDGKDPYDDTSLKNAFNRGIDYYRSKVKEYNFVGHNDVLDLMCGFGRWSIFLSEYNKTVTAIDWNEGAINIGQGMSDYLGIKNITFNAGDVLTTKQFPDSSFDAVWIWNALIYVERGPCLKEVYRVLRPGGKVLVGAMNSSGRLVEKIIYGLSGFSSRHRSHLRQAASALWNGSFYDGRPNYSTYRSAKKVFERFGFEVTNIEIAGTNAFGIFPRNLNIILKKRI